MSRRLAPSGKRRTALLGRDFWDYSKMMGVYSSKQEFINIILWRNVRGEAPDWAKNIARRFATFFYDDRSLTHLSYMTSRFLVSEEKARAAQVVIAAFYPNLPENGDGDFPLSYLEGEKVWRALEDVLWPI